MPTGIGSSILGLSKTLIRDADCICQPALFNGRSLLALTGTTSEAEPHVLRAHLDVSVPSSHFGQRALPSLLDMALRIQAPGISTVLIHALSRTHRGGLKFPRSYIIGSSASPSRRGPE